MQRDAKPMDLTLDEISDELLSTANDWFARLNSAERIENIWLDFEHWLHADPLHDRAFRALEDTYNALADLGMLKRFSD